jgi:glycosyltransferase involved in cell wall biosynthesis
LPFGAALAANLSGSTVIYHVHEVNIRPALLKLFLVKIADIFADRLIFVSAFVKDQFNFPPGKTTVIYNALPDQFVNEAMKAVAVEKDGPFTVLMLCSLKAYKGVYRFVELAKLLPGIRFVLVLNTSAEERDVFQREANAPANCTIYPVQKVTAQFYKKAHVVLNLSIPGQWLETFGMTILEGMVYGLPAIVPPVGGVTELITDGAEGLYIDSGNVKHVAAAIIRLSTDENYYDRMASAALCKAGHFSQASFRGQITGAFNVSELPVQLIQVMEK